MMTLLRRLCPWIKRPLFWIVLLGAVLRLISWTVEYPMMRWQNDARMSIPAIRLLEGKGISLQDDAGPTAYRPPLYILWLAMGYAIFGKFATLGPSFLQILVSSANIALLNLLAKEIWKDKRIAQASAFLLAIHPYVIYHDPALYHTFLSSALLLSGCLFLLKGLEMQRSQFLFFSGLFFGACVLVISTIVPFLFLILVGMLALWRIPLIKRFAFVGVFLLGLAVSWGPWIVRNAFAFKSFIPLTTESGVTLWMGNNPESIWRLRTREHESSPVPKGTRFAIPSQYTGCATPDWCQGGIKENQENRELTAMAFSWIKQHPRTFFSLTIWRFSNIWSPFLTPAKIFFHPLLTALVTYGYAFWNLALAGLVLTGLWLSWKSKTQFPLLLLCLLALTGTAGYSFFLYYTKYRIPFETVLLAFAGAGLMQLLERFASTHLAIAKTSCASRGAYDVSSRADSSIYSPHAPVA